ncbi:MAG: general secretion pathway protein GspK [Sedimentisphaerales bacterium]|nr:general secretion pathway protein GspK [Sedimentisphaerales bacterium]
MKANRTKKHREGFILVVVLCTIIMLGALLFGFNGESRDNLLAADALKISAQALSCAEAGLNIAMAALKRSDAERWGLMGLLIGEKEIALADGTCLVTVCEESGKLNLNLLKTSEGTPDRTRIDQVLRLIDLLNRSDLHNSTIGYGLIPAIIDWIDSDEETTSLAFVAHDNRGAESDYYRDLDPPYRCKNAPLDITEELLLIKGITPEVFERIRDYVTVKGDGKININNASQLVIESLSENMDTALARMIVIRRREKPFSSLAELRDIPGMTAVAYQAIKRVATVRPQDNYYQITSRGSAAGSDQTIVTLIQRKANANKLEMIQYKEL